MERCKVYTLAGPSTNMHETIVSDAVVIQALLLKELLLALSSSTEERRSDTGR